jgi:hypothetical protein
MAEVPLSFGLLLFGAALADVLDGEGSGALRRLAVAAAWIAATKNEGLFFAAAGCAIALALGGRRRWKAALAALPTALLIQGLHLAWRGRLPLRDFDFGAFTPARMGEALAAPPGAWPESAAWRGWPSSPRSRYWAPTPRRAARCSPSPCAARRRISSCRHSRCEARAG